MPVPALQNIAKEENVSLPTVEKAWEEAKKKVLNDKQDNWGLVMKVTRQIVRKGKTMNETFDEVYDRILEEAAQEKYIPPIGAQKAAQRAIKWKEEHPDEVKAMTRVGWTRARQLANREPLSLDVVKRMARFRRHRSNAKIDPKFKNEPWKDRGYISWLGWGGDPGIEWAARIVNSIKD